MLTAASQQAPASQPAAAPTPAPAAASVAADVVFEPADEGGLEPEWMAVKNAGWTEPPAGFADGASLVGRRIFVLDEGFGSVTKHKAKRRG
eukprot:COSAG01_NODE_26315_length_717_cov_966.938511_1_plen_90_part_10